MNRSFWIIIVTILLGSSSLFAFGFQERPKWNKRTEPAKTVPEKPAKISAFSQNRTAPKAPEVAPVSQVSTADMAAFRDSLQKSIQRKDYLSALDVLSKIPDSDKTLVDQQMVERLTTVLTVRENEKTQPALLKSDGELDPETLKLINSLYTKAENFYVMGQQNIAKDFLIHTLFLHRRYFSGREFLKLAYDLAPGAYKVEDIQNKYWKLSETYFYGGNYERALTVLDTLTYFDKENYRIYERIGSSHYMLGDKKKALEAWTTALFLHPGDAQLEEVIVQAKQFIEEDQKQAEDAAKAALSQKVEKKTDLVQTEAQLLGVFPTQTQAYAYAQKLREQKLTATVEELENGKWAVKVAKSQLSKRTTQ
ncbi:MAG: hypothetical protein EXS67_03955 [Candidatus Margulisbacteria bacterium]|nr:hypothetical protein [Candidatus Margulisiibacteriota bacterium]